MVGMAIQRLQYYLAEHPAIVNFRWSHIHSWGSTWLFLFSSIGIYLASALLLSLVLIKRRRPVPLGLLPALHSLAIAVVSAAIFIGISLSTVAEIRDTRWLWRRSKTPIQWLLCFPLGTRPSGRVFFWSYMFYISRFLLPLRTFFSILRRRPLTFFRLFHCSILIFMSFLWLEFSQSFQVVAILSTTLIYSIMYGYRFWTSVGWPVSCFPVVVNCQILLLGCYLAAHIGVLLLHFRKEGCNGIGAWVFNSFLNGTLLLLFLNFYIRKHLKGSRMVEDDDHPSPSSNNGESCELEGKKES
ncbi:elongation of fatty acids protein 3-like [Nymphaea colorata]|uniref:Elongation of fatty acids protein 3-like n=1 Tax=Nymphaea colorata TaxID=210225 RepID=A0A5K1BSJ9_9MAGN|nr:elongation of fatty acids protein 3-like [Nymphaea colorata]